MKEADWHEREADLHLQVHQLTEVNLLIDLYIYFYFLFFVFALDEIFLL